MATPRQLEALIRLSEAWARLHLREAVAEADVTAAYHLWWGGLVGGARGGGVEVREGAGGL